MKVYVKVTKYDQFSSQCVAMLKPKNPTTTKQTKKPETLKERQRQ